MTRVNSFVTLPKALDTFSYKTTWKKTDYAKASKADECVLKYQHVPSTDSIEGPD